MANHFDIPYENLVERNIGILSVENQEKIRRMCVAVIGVGGVGGLTAVLAAKTGFGKLVVADRDRFEVSNLNRQILATAKTLGRNKAEVAMEVLTKHNPYVEVRGEVADINSEQKAVKILKGVDILIVAVDNFETRIRLLRATKHLGIPAILTGPLGWKLFVTTVMPDGPDYEALIGAPSLGQELTPAMIEVLGQYQREFLFHSGGFLPECVEEIRSGKSPIKTIAPVVNLTSCAAIAELTKWATGHGQLFVCPQYFTFDLLTLKPWSLEEVGMKSLQSLNSLKH